MHLLGAKVRKQPLPCSTTFSGFLSLSKKAHCHQPGFWVLNSMTPTHLSTHPHLLCCPHFTPILQPNRFHYFLSILNTFQPLSSYPLQTVCLEHLPATTLFPEYMHTPQLCRALRSAPPYGNLKRCLIVPVPTSVRRLFAPQLEAKSEPSPRFLGHREGQTLLKNRSVFSHQSCLLRNTEYLTLMTTTLKKWL